LLLSELSSYATLHKELQPFLNSLSEEVLRTYSNFWYKHGKHKEMCLDPSHVSTSVIKGVDLSLQALEEVKKSEGYTTLHSQLVGETEKTRLEWTKKFTLKVHDMNRQALLRRFKHAFCKLLP